MANLPPNRRDCGRDDQMQAREAATPPLKNSALIAAFVKRQRQPATRANGAADQRRCTVDLPRRQRL